MQSTISSYLKDVKMKKFINTKKLEKPQFMRNYSFSSKLYKFFIYDEQSYKWRYNDIFDDFTKENRLFDSDNRSAFPLVLLFNSDKEESIKLCSKVAKNFIYKKNEANENDIFVFGILGNNADDLGLKCPIDFDICCVRPIYLILNLPESKKNLPNLNCIIFQIYSFLYFICDFKIIIAHEKYYMEQINFGNEIHVLWKSICNFEKEGNSKGSNTNKEISKTKKKDDDDDDDNEEEEDLIDENENNKKTYLLHLFEENFTPKDMKTIILFNNKQIHYTKIPVKLKAENGADRAYINIDEPFTYEVFLNILRKSMKQNKKFFAKSFSDIKILFQFLPLFRMTSFYISAVFDKKLDLKKKIEDRYLEIKKADMDNHNEFVLISMLQKEILKTFPIIDRKYFDKCNLILTEISKGISQENQDYILKELHLSSVLYLGYLGYIYESRVYWTDEEIEGLKNSYVNFLKEEYFDIIKYNYPIEKIPIIYANNEKMLLYIIKQAYEEFEFIFREYKKKIELKNQIREVEMEKGTNYTIRERENEREIKVRVELDGNLEKLIPTDF